MSQDSHGVVLLVDGHSAQRRFYSDILSVRGYAVYPAANLTDAERFLADDMPSVILLDVALKDPDGIAACTRLRERLGERVPILFFAATDSMEVVLAALRAGGDDYIVKSGSPTMLLDRIAHWRDADRGDIAARRGRAIAYLEMQIARAAAAKTRQEGQAKSDPAPAARKRRRPFST